MSKRKRLGNEGRALWIRAEENCARVAVVGSRYRRSSTESNEDMVMGHCVGPKVTLSIYIRFDDNKPYKSYLVQIKI